MVTAKRDDSWISPSSLDRACCLRLSLRLEHAASSLVFFTFHPYHLHLRLPRVLSLLSCFTFKRICLAGNSIYIYMYCYNWSFRQSWRTSMNLRKVQDKFDLSAHCLPAKQPILMLSWQGIVWTSSSHRQQGTRNPLKNRGKFGLYSRCKTSRTWRTRRRESSGMAQRHCFWWQEEYQLGKPRMTGSRQIGDTRAAHVWASQLPLHFLGFIVWSCLVMSSGWSLVTPVGGGVIASVVWSLLPPRSFECRCFSWNQLLKYSSTILSLHNQVVYWLDLWVGSNPFFLTLKWFRFVAFFFLI